MKKLKIEVKLTLELWSGQQFFSVVLYPKNDMSKKAKNYLHNHYEESYTNGHLHYYCYSTFTLKETLTIIEKDLQAINAEIENIDEYNNIKTKGPILIDRDKEEKKRRREMRKQQRIDALKEEGNG